MRKLFASLLVVVCASVLTAAPSARAADEEKSDEPAKIEAAEVDLGRPVVFEKDVLPILEKNCLACHNVAIDESSFVVEDVESILKGGKRGAAVVPGKPADSLLFQLASRAKKPAMPPMPNEVDAAALTPKQLGIIRQWILEGAKKGEAASGTAVSWQPVPSRIDAIYSVALSPWGRFAAAGRANRISIYDLASKQEVARLADPNLSELQYDGSPMYPYGAAHRDFVNAMAFSPDGTLLASGGYRVVKLWKRATRPKRHELAAGGEVTAAAVDAAGTWAAVASADNTITLWNLDTGQPGKKLQGHGGAITGLAFWPRPEQKAEVDQNVESAETRVREAAERLGAAREALADFQRNPENKKLSQEEFQAKQEQLAAAVTNAEKALDAAEQGAQAAREAQAAFDKQIAEQSRLFSCSKDKTVRVWNPADGSQIAQLDTPAPLGDVTVNKDGTQFVTAGEDNTLRVWAYPIEKPEQPADQESKDENEQPAEATIKPLKELKGHGQPVTSVALLYAPGTQVVSGSRDGTVRTWDLNNGNQIRAMNHGGPVLDVAASPDGSRVVSVSENNVGKLWQTNNGKQLAELKGDVNLKRRAADLDLEKTIATQVASLAGKAQENADKALKNRQEAAKKAKEEKDKADKALQEPQKKFKEAEEKLKAAKEELANKPDDNNLKNKVNQAQKAFDQARDAFNKAQDAQKQAARSLELAQQAEERAKTALDEAKKEKEQADARQKQAEQQLAEAQKAEQEAPKPLRAVAFSADGTKIVTGGDDNQLHLWDGSTGQPLHAFPAHEGPVTALAFGPHETIVSGAADKKAASWNANPRWTLVATLGPQGDNPLDVSNSRFVNRVTSLDFSPDGKLLATGGGDPSRAGELMIWDVESRKLVREFEEAHSDTVYGVEFSHDGKKIVSGAADKFVKTFDVQTGEHIRSYEGHTHHVLDVSWKADRSTIVSAGADEVIKVWNAETGEQRRTISNHGKQVTSIQYIGTTDNFISASGDRTVRLFTASNGRNIRNFGGSGDFVYAAACTRDQTIAAAGGEDGVLRVWNAQNGQSIATFAPPPRQPSPATSTLASAAGR